VIAMTFLNQHILLGTIHKTHANDNIMINNQKNINQRVCGSTSWCAIILCQVLAFFLYAIAGIFGFLTFGFSTPDNIMDSSSEDDILWLGVRVLSLIVYFISCIPASVDTFMAIAPKYIPFTIFDDKLDRTESSWQRLKECTKEWIFRNIFCSGLAAFGIYGYSLFKIYQIIGSAVDPWILYIMPSLSCCLLVLKDITYNLNLYDNSDFFQSMLYCCYSHSPLKKGEEKEIVNFKSIKHKGGFIISTCIIFNLGLVILIFGTLISFKITTWL
jgi:amino acid permease